MPRGHGLELSGASVNVMATVAAPTLQDARRIAEEIARDDARVGRVLVFGSVARGDAGPDSDLDLVLLLAEDFSGDLPKAKRELHDLVVRRCGAGSDVIVRTEQQWKHLTANVSASFDAAIAEETTELFARPSRSSSFGGSNGSLEGVARDNLDPAVSRLRSAIQELDSIERSLRAIPEWEADRIPERVASGLTTVDHERRSRYLRLLTDAHMAVEMAAKSVIAAEGTTPRRSHDIDELVSRVKDRPAREALDTATTMPHESDGRMRNWRFGMYETADDDDWQASVNAANAADHIRAAVAAVRIAADFLDERATRGEHTAATAHARAAADAVDQADIDEASLTTGAGLYEPDAT